MEQKPDEKGYLINTYHTSFNTQFLTQDLLTEIVDSYKNAKGKKEDERISQNTYNSILQFCLFCLSTLNSNRKSDLSKIKMRDFRAARLVYQDEEGGELLVSGGSFRGKVVELQPSSGACKTGKPISIYFNQFCLQLTNMMRDMMEWYFVGDKESKVRLSYTIRV